MKTVEQNNKWNYLKGNGTLLSEDWFDESPTRFVNKNGFYGKCKTHSIYFISKTLKIRRID